MSVAMKYLRNVATIALDARRCVGCLRCLEVCPRGVLESRGRPARAAIVDRDACIECSACAANCRYGAITVQAGVGCAWAVLRGLRTGGPPSCDCAGPSAPASPGCGGQAQPRSGSGCCGT